MFAPSVPRESLVRPVKTGTPVFLETWELTEKRESQGPRVSTDSKDLREQLVPLVSLEHLVLLEKRETKEKCACTHMQAKKVSRDLKDSRESLEYLVNLDVMVSTAKRESLVSMVK